MSEEMILHEEEPKPKQIVLDESFLRRLMLIQVNENQRIVDEIQDLRTEMKNNQRDLNKENEKLKNSITSLTDELKEMRENYERDLRNKGIEIYTLKMELVKERKRMEKEKKKNKMLQIELENTWYKYLRRKAQEIVDKVYEIAEELKVKIVDQFFYWFKDLVQNLLPISWKKDL